MNIPQSADVVIIGGGMHGLSTALHLAQSQTNQKIVVLDKSKLGNGATAIACGVVRNNYYQPAMRRLMAHSVALWEKYAKELYYNPVGYLQISFEGMHAGVSEIYQQQKEIGYESVFIEGEKESMDYMKGIFDDWQAKNITSVLHEKRGGFAYNVPSIMGLQKLVTNAGAQVYEEVEVLAMIENDASNSVSKIETNQGTIECGEVVVAPGPWVKNFWDMLNLPNKIQIKGQDGKMHTSDMWNYWMLQEGVLDLDPSMLRDNAGNVPPVVHVDSDAPLYSDRDGKLLTEDPWGIYYKPDDNFNGIQGGFAPYEIKESADQVKIDPYGKHSKDYLVTEEFIDIWCSALAFCQKRFEGMSAKYRRHPSGGLGCLTPDRFPVFDRFRDNVYFIADANHGYKMLGVGALVADELQGKTSDLLEPFRFSRYEKGELHPISSSPFPWS